MASSPKTYRHTASGLVAEYPPGLAAAFADVLTEITPETQPDPPAEAPARSRHAAFDDLIADKPHTRRPAESEPVHE